MRKAIVAVLVPVLAAAELPVKEVILFKHGVGFFARSGEVRAGETVKLDFKASDMNDVLKSLTVTEKGGGKITGVRYDSAEPVEQKLEQFPFVIGEKFALSAVLDQMKGARMEIKYGSDTIAGSVVSGRETAAGATGHTTPKEQLILLLDSGEIRVFDLAASGGVRFTDPAVQRQFVEYLRAVNQARSKDKRSVYVDSNGTGTRLLTASYMMPAPVWKSSYRLAFDNSEPTLEGWAIVDNTTDEDWNQIQLAVVSGRPISFISRLYEPRYRSRPAAELPEEKSLPPVLYGAALETSGAAAPAPSPPAPEAAMKAQAGRMAGGFAGSTMSGSFSGGPTVAVQDQVHRSQAAAEQGESTVAVATESRELGELFEYRFSTPVTVRKSESAMLPFLQQKLNGRKLLIYQESEGPNPRNAAEISNSTGKTLDGGPITIYDGGVYAGEALMETLKSGDKRLISYAVDLGTRVTTAIDSERSAVRQVTAKRGIVKTKWAVEETKTYTIKNVDAKPKTLIIEHPLRQGYKLLSAVKPIETTAKEHRFEVRLAPSANEKFVVREESLHEELVSIMSYTHDAVSQFIAGKSLSDSARKQLQQIADHKRQIAEAEQQARAIETELNELVRDQERIRQNIASLRSVSGQDDQVQKYSRQLAAQEAQVAAMRDQVREQRRRKQTLDKEVAAMIERLEF